MRSLTRSQWISIAVPAVALLGLTFIAWPLVLFLIDRLPETSRGRILLGALFTVVFVAGLVWVSRTFRWLGWLIIAAWAVAIATIAGIVLVVWLILGSPGLEEVSRLSPQNLDAIATRAFAIVAGLGGVAFLVIAYRRQRTTENGEQREIAKLFTESFDSASEKLGSEYPAVRLAGIHALARLADEAPEGREDLVQMVIDVLCAYLRMPYTPALRPLSEGATPEQAVEHRDHELGFAASREVRHTVIRIIGDRLRKDRENTRWRGKDYDFTGTVFDGGDFHGAVFNGGKVSFNRASFTGGWLDFSNVEFSGCTVSFNRASFTGGTVSFEHARFTGGEVSLGLAEFTGGEVYFGDAEFSGSKLVFALSSFSGSTVDFSLAEFTGGEVLFNQAKFTDGKVSFDLAELSGGLSFRHASGACPIGLLEAVELGGPERLELPELWQSSADEDHSSL